MNCMFFIIGTLKNLRTQTQHNGMAKKIILVNPTF